MLELEKIVNRKNQAVTNKLEKEMLIRTTSKEVKEYIVNSSICEEFEKYFNEIKIDLSNNKYCKNEGYELTITTNKGYRYNSISLICPFNDLKLHVSYYDGVGQRNKDFIIPLNSNCMTKVKTIKNAFRFLFTVTYDS